MGETRAVGPSALLMVCVLQSLLPLRGVPCATSSSRIITETFTAPRGSPWSQRVFSGAVRSASSGTVFFSPFRAVEMCPFVLHHLQRCFVIQHPPAWGAGGCDSFRMFSKWSCDTTWCPYDSHPALRHALNDTVEAFLC